MNRTEITLETLHERVAAFYEPARWRFLTVNATDTGTALQIDWIFVPIGRREEPIVLGCVVDYETPLPSLREKIPAAALSEAEMLDLLGAQFEGAQSGLFLEPDAPRAPLRKAQSGVAGD